MTSFIDEIGFMRFEGRFRRANLSNDQKHSIILDAKHEAIHVLLKHEHRENWHEGKEHVQSVVQKLFLGICLKSPLGSIKYHCVNLSDLSPEQVSHRICPFESTGVNYLVQLMSNFCGEA